MPCSAAGALEIILMTISAIVFLCEVFSGGGIAVFLGADLVGSWRRRMMRAPDVLLRTGLGHSVPPMLFRLAAGLLWPCAQEERAPAGIIPAQLTRRRDAISTARPLRVIGGPMKRLR